MTVRPWRAQPSTAHGRAGALALVLVLALLTLAGCGDSGSSDPEGPTGREQDVAFAAETMRLHAESLTLVDLTLGRKLPAEVTALAEEVRAEQSGQVESLADLLTQWGEELPETMRDHLHAEDEGGAELPSVVGHARLRELERADDQRFPELWLTAMTEMHRAIVESAQRQLDAGEDEGAIDLARTILDGHESRLERLAP